MTAALSAVPEAEQCGWVKDRFGLSWQIVPRRLLALLADPDAGSASVLQKAEGEEQGEEQGNVGLRALCQLAAEKPLHATYRPVRWVLPLR